MNLSFAYDKGDGADVLSKIDLEIEAGDFVSIVGGNGSGKSTLAKMFNALLTPNEGVVVVCGVKTFNREMVFEVRRQVGMVFQNPDSQIVATVVEEDVAFAMENLCVPVQKIETKIEQVLSMVDMAAYRKNLVYGLSGGQKQRVAIAGVLAMEPKCIVFDEATSMLDPEGRKKVFEIMQDLNKKNGVTVVNITHNMEEAVKSERVVVMSDGKVLKICTPRQLFSDELLLKTAKLDCLPVTELVNRLAKCGLIERQTVLSVDECVDVIEKLLKGSLT